MPNSLHCHSANAAVPGVRIRNQSRRKLPSVATKFWLSLSVGALAALAAQPARAQLQRSLNNPSFEANNPQGPGAPTFEIFPNALVPGWDTTTGEVELWDSGFQGIPAAAGNVFAELNANRPGTLYQNACMINGDFIRWKFSHRARGTGTETVSFQIASSTGTLLQNMQTSAVVKASGWVVRSNTVGVTYVGTTGLQRVQFTTTDLGSNGNFLDDIQIQLATYLEFDPANTSSKEGAGSPTLPGLRLTGVVAAPFNVVINITGGTATLGSDYTTPSGSSSFTVTVPAGNYQYSVIPLGITILNDSVAEGNETIQLAITPLPRDFTLTSTTNCGAPGASGAIHTILDRLLINATNDTVAGINGASGATAVLNAFAGDTIGGVAVTSTNATLSVVSGSAVPAGLTFNTGTGAVDVAPGTPAGSYTFDYQICETANPTNCKTATASVTVSPSVELVISKSNGTTLVTSGDTTTYTLTVTNSGPDTATGAIVRDTPVAGLSCPATNAVTITGNGVPAGSFTVADLTGAGITLGTLASGQSATLSYSCTVN